MIYPVLLAVAVLAASSYGREYSCTIDEIACTGTRVQTITVQNVRMCCPHGASFKLNDSQCVCVDDATEEPCREGVQSCRDASSFSTDSRGVIRCCMPGYGLNSISRSFVNGHLIDICTCTRMGSGGFLSSFMGMDHTGSLVINSGNSGVQVYPSVGGSSVNMTEIRNQWRQIGEGWKQWGQQFANNFRSWGQNFARNMHQTGRELARSLTGTFQRTLGSALADAVQLDCGVSTVGGKSTQPTCTEKPAEVVKRRHPVAGATGSDIIIYSCPDQNVSCNSPSRYRVGHPKRDTSVKASRDDTAQWTCLAGLNQDACAIPPTIYPADVSDSCLATMPQDRVKVTCTMSKAYPSSINCVWYEYSIPVGRPDLENDTRATQVPQNNTYLENWRSDAEEGKLYDSASCRLLRNVTSLVGTSNYSVVVSPSTVFRSPVAILPDSLNSSALLITPDSAASNSTSVMTAPSDSTTCQITASSNTISRNATYLFIAMSLGSETNQLTSAPSVIFGVIVGVFVYFVVIILGVTYCKRRLPQIKLNEGGIIDGFEMPHPDPQHLATASSAPNEYESPVNQSALLRLSHEQTTRKNIISSSPQGPQRSDYLTPEIPSRDIMSEANSFQSPASACHPASKCSACCLKWDLKWDLSVLPIK